MTNLWHKSLYWLRYSPLICNIIVSNEACWQLTSAYINIKPCDAAVLHQHGFCHCCCLLWGFSGDEKNWTAFSLVSRCCYMQHLMLCKTWLCQEQRSRVKWNRYPSGKLMPTAAWEGSPHVLLIHRERAWSMFLKQIPHRWVCFWLWDTSLSLCCCCEKCLTEPVSWQQYVARPVWAGPASP